MKTYRHQQTGDLFQIIEQLPYFQKLHTYLVIRNVRTQQKFLVGLEEFQQEFLQLEQELTTGEKLALFQSVFRCRLDVYAKSYINKEGKLQYFPSYVYGWKNLPKEKRQTEPLTTEVLKQHLRGEISIGIFPVFKDDTCWFLAMDFDGKDWQASSKLVKQIALENGFASYLEISRSGQGAHLWFFFDHNIPCQLARCLGKKLLELAMQASKSISFDSFDRLFPNQDYLPEGGVGNLIALPLQGEDYARGHRVFVDDDFRPYPNQWEVLQNVRRLRQDQIEQFLEFEILTIADDKEIRLALSNELLFSKAELSAKTLHYLKKLASFANPEYYLKRRLRQPTYQVPEGIYLFRETDEDLFLPRGLLDQLQEKFPDLIVDDRRPPLRQIKVGFKGELRFDQEVALLDLTRFDQGFLTAETGFGKTVLAAALIAEKKCRTLILVHNKQLFNQWLERLRQFLDIAEPPAKRWTATGREKIIGTIGQFQSGKHWRSRLVDVAMIQSLARLDNIEQVLDDYDMLLLDECHHITALMFEGVVAKFGGRFLYGLTATPERKNGHQPILYQRLEPQRHQALGQAVAFTKKLSLKLTSFGQLDDNLANSSDFVEIC